jgi:hypothetical protein
MNALIYGDAPRTSSIIYVEIVSCIVSKVNPIRNMALLMEYFILPWDFLMIFSILFDLFFFFCLF